MVGFFILFLKSNKFGDIGIDRIKEWFHLLIVTEIKDELNNRFHFGDIKSGNIMLFETLLSELFIDFLLYERFVSLEMEK